MGNKMQPFFRQVRYVFIVFAVNLFATSVAIFTNEPISAIFTGVLRPNHPLKV
jgi:hypothetical protein